jgi:hypothetical protein
MTTDRKTAHCLRCRGLLTDPASVARGTGRTCARIIRQQETALRIAAAFTTGQCASARELIEDSAIVHMRADLFQSVSSDGTSFYLTAARGNCNCPAGLKSHLCYHLLSARLLLAA